jgi:hypothetical protein
MDGIPGAFVFFLLPIMALLLARRLLKSRRAAMRLFRFHVSSSVETE